MKTPKSSLVWWTLAALLILSVLAFGLLRAGIAVTDFSEGYRLRPHGTKLPVGSTGQLDLSTMRDGDIQVSYLFCFESKSDLDRFLQDMFTGDKDDRYVREMSARRLGDRSTLRAVAQSGFGQIDLQVQVEYGSMQGIQCWIPNGRYFKNVRITKTQSER
jgi:hypothetical protein